MPRVAIAPLYRWRLLADRPALAERLGRELALHPIVAQALVNRKVEDARAARRLLAPSLSELPDPSELPEFPRALAALRSALRLGAPVLIHGDYDADGICGSVLLLRLLRRLRHPASVFLPDRFRDGYSFGAASLRAVEEREARLVIAVDNGTSAVEALDELARRGVEVVVLDHHQPGARLPSCAALVNPWCAPEGGACRELCATAIAWIAAWGLLRHVRGERQLPDGDRRFLVDALGLVALATVADVMPLRGPSRTLVVHGLRTLRASGFGGIRALAEAAGLSADPSAEDLAFRLAPRLNAAGRLGQAEVALELLSATNLAEARALARRIEDLNGERRRLEQEEFERLRPVALEAAAAGARVLFLGRSDAHFGILGIVSNRLVDATGLPAFLWAEVAPGLARGSARSPAGIDALELLRSVGSELRDFGGHPRAAGFSFLLARRERIAEGLERAAEALPPAAAPSLDVDLEVAPGDITPPLVRELERLGPFGAGNPRPTFLCSEARLAAPPRTMGDGSHASLLLERGGAAVRAVAFRMARRVAGLEVGEALDVVFEASLNGYRGQPGVEWTVRDLRSALA